MCRNSEEFQWFTRLLAAIEADEKLSDVVDLALYWTVKKTSPQLVTHLHSSLQRKNKLGQLTDALTGPLQRRAAADTGRRHLGRAESAGRGGRLATFHGGR